MELKENRVEILETRYGNNITVARSEIGGRYLLSGAELQKLLDDFGAKQRENCRYSYDNGELGDPYDRILSAEQPKIEELKL